MTVQIVRRIFKMNSSDSNIRPLTDGPQTRANRHLNDLVIETRTQAEEVLHVLRGMIVRFYAVTVSDLYELTDLTTEFNDSRWGWYDLSAASVRADRGGWMLNLPPTYPMTS